MTAMKLWFDAITIHQDKGVGINDITPDIRKMICASGIQNGSAAITATGSTGSVTTIEYEPGVIEDLKDAVNRIAPPGAVYQHELAWHDGNGHSHVQAAVIGPSVTVPIRKGTLRLGTWQQVVVINHDNHARQRTVEITITGEQQFSVKMKKIE
jgi:secondary thiamine-phosphate synthase enzyme